MTPSNLDKIKTVIETENPLPTISTPLKKSKKLRSLMPSRSVLKVRSLKPKVIGLKTKKED